MSWWFKIDLWKRVIVALVLGLAFGLGLRYGMGAEAGNTLFMVLSPMAKYLCHLLVDLA